MNNIFEDFKNIGRISNLPEEYEHPSPEHLEGEDLLESENSRRNFTLFYLISFLIFSVLVFKLLNLQISRGAYNKFLAEGNRVRAREITAPRGVILDRNGNELASDTPSFNLVLFPADLPKDKTERQKLFEKISDVSEIPLENFQNFTTQQLLTLEPIILKEDLERDEALLLEMKLQGIPAVEIAKIPQRVYKVPESLSHILGYIGKISKEELEKNSDYNLSDIVGKSGVEKVYEKELQGEDGKEQVEVDAKGQIQRILATKEAQPGKILTLSIDAELQDKAAYFLENGIKNAEAQKGVAIVQNPQNGEILAMISYPYFDNNLFLGEDVAKEYKKLSQDKNRPLLNRAISGLYPSGSTIKPLVASAGLQEGVISEKTTINAPGEIKVGQFVFPDWKVHGLTDVKKAIAQSVNVFFYAIGGGWDKIQGLGVEKMDQYLDKFGLGKKTKIDLPGEAEGLVPSPDWKEKTKGERWYIGDTYHLAIGQGDILVTPLQLLNAISSIANDGTLYRPHLVFSISNPDKTNKVETKPEALNFGFISGDNLKIVREGMRQAVTTGSARLLSDLSVETAGKTGTAQFGSEGKTHAWFAGFGPYDNPQLSVIILVEGGGEGFSAAAPIAKDILNYYFTR